MRERFSVVAAHSVPAIDAGIPSYFSMLQRILFMGQRDAELMLPAPGSAIISITDPEAPAASLNGGWVSVLRLSFDDIDPRFSEPEDGAMTPISESQADAVAAFAAQVATTCRTIVVHCRYGQSRSAAIARALCECRGFAVPEATLAANPFVYEQVKQSLIRFSVEGRGSLATARRD